MYKLNEEEMFYDCMEGIAIVIDFQTGVYFGFNSFGTFVINSLLSGSDETLIAEALTVREGCPENIKHVIIAFAEKLVEKKILIKTDGDPVKPEMDDELLKEGYEPEFEECTEVKDLILADPIHEVDTSEE